MASFLLTTLDNPYNPWTDWDSWYNYDTIKGYDTCGQLARIAPPSLDSLPEEYTDSLRDIAIDSLIDLFPNIFTKISEEVSEEEFKKIREANLERFKVLTKQSEKSS